MNGAMRYMLNKIKMFAEGWLHPKNKIGLGLLSKYIDIDFTYDSSKKYDWILCFDKIKHFHENTIYGPHIMPQDIDQNMIFKKNQLFNTLSPWVENLVKKLKPNLNCISLPFPVDKNRFTPRKKIGLPVIYYKKVKKEKLEKAISLVKDHVLFDYSIGYNELDFLEAISIAPYAIWVGCHESQGFAFQETLSCNTPIFVINVRSSREEVGSVWEKDFPGIELEATSASYFSKNCGKISYMETIEEDINEFMENIKNYTPRDFILENFSANACANIWINKLKDYI